MPRESVKPELLETAYRIVQRDGVAKLTLDAVAQEAGVSKGGVLYHFPSKNALVSEMVLGLNERFEADLETAFAQESDTPGRWLRAFVRASAWEGERGEDSLTVQTGAALMAAAGNDPALLTALREKWDIWQAKAVQSGVDPATATVIRLAADGLWLTDLFGLASPTGTLRGDVIKRLCELATPKVGNDEAEEDR